VAGECETTGADELKRGNVMQLKNAIVCVAAAVLLSATGSAQSTGVQDELCLSVYAAQIRQYRVT
jgi:hypothetical protein